MWGEGYERLVWERGGSGVAVEGDGDGDGDGASNGYGWVGVVVMFVGFPKEHHVLVIPGNFLTVVINPFGAEAHGMMYHLTRGKFEEQTAVCHLNRFISESEMDTSIHRQLMAYLSSD